MFRLIKIIWLIAALLTAGSCAEKGNVPETLLRAETVMEETPDSALRLLKGIAPAELGTRGDSALYNLLLTQAKYKCFEDITADSMINRSADYFTAAKDSRHSMLATYYMGNRYFDLGEYGKAIKCYLKAEELAKGLADHHYTGLIDGSIAQVYKKIYNRGLELDYMECSHKEHRESKDEKHIISSLSYLILAYYDNKQRQRAIDLADSALKFEAMNRYPEYRMNIELVKGFAQNSQKDYTGAIATLEKVSDELSDAPAHLYRNIGMAYYSLGDTAKAEEWLGKIDPAKGEENFIPWEVYADRGDYREAFNALRAEYRDIDRRVSALLRDNVSRAVAEYDESEVRDARERAGEERLQKWIAVGALVLAAAGFALYRRHKTARLREVMAMVDEMHPRIAGDSADDTEGQFVTYRQKFVRINDLCDNYYSARGDERRQKRALDALARELREFRRARGTLHDLEDQLNRGTDNLMANFRADFPDLTESQHLMMMLIFAGFSSSAICLILGVKLQTFYNHKSQVRKIVEGRATPLRSRYLYFCHRGG